MVCACACGVRVFLCGVVRVCLVCVCGVVYVYVCVQFVLLEVTCKVHKLFYYACDCSSLRNKASHFCTEKLEWFFFSNILSKNCVNSCCFEIHSTDFCDVGLEILKPV